MNKGIFISLGGNLGEVQSTFVDAIELLEERGVFVVKESSIYQTEPVGNTDQDWFYNQVIQIETELNPHELLETCLAVEKILGRIRTEENWGPRFIDIDLICFDQEIIDTKDLTLPHPQAYKRRFVLIPLVEIAPDFTEPTTHKTVKELLSDLERSDKSEVIKVE